MTFQISPHAQKTRSLLLQKFGFEVKLCHLSDKFIEIVKNPAHGHGRNMNPCIDCRILMLKEAKKLMDMTGSDFIITGEVIGQRPMSQMRNTLAMIDKKAGVSGIVLRPLSAKLFEPTIHEINGIIDRDKLHDFNGRSRKQQMALAKEVRTHGLSHACRRMPAYRAELFFQA